MKNCWWKESISQMKTTNRGSSKPIRKMIHWSELKCNKVFKHEKRGFNTIPHFYQTCIISGCSKEKHFLLIFFEEKRGKYQFGEKLLKVLWGEGVRGRLEVVEIFVTHLTMKPLKKERRNCSWINKLYWILLFILRARYDTITTNAWSNIIIVLIVQLRCFTER